MNGCTQHFSVLRSFGKMFEEPNPCFPPQLHHLTSPPATHTDSYFSISCQHFFHYFFRIIFGCTGSSSLCSGFVQCAGFSLQWLLLLWSMGSGVCGLSSCGTWALLPHGTWDLPNHGSNPHSLHWQADSHPLCHQESPRSRIFNQAHGWLHRIKPTFLVLFFK